MGEMGQYISRALVDACVSRNDSYALHGIRIGEDTVALRSVTVSIFNPAIL